MTEPQAMLMMTLRPSAARTPASTAWRCPARAHGDDEHVGPVREIAQRRVVRVTHVDAPAAIVVATSISKAAALRNAFADGAQSVDARLAAGQSAHERHSLRVPTSPRRRNALASNNRRTLASPIARSATDALWPDCTSR
jgi:hypothetical protein